MAERKKTETVVVTLRIKEALRRRLETAATHNEVSVNSEITRRLEESFTRAELTSLRETTAALLEIARAMLDKQADKKGAHREPAINALTAAAELLGRAETVTPRKS